MSINTESIRRSIANLESELNSLKAQLSFDSAPVKAIKAKKVKDPNAEPKEANVWIKFTQRVVALIKEAHPDNKAPATEGKQFCSFLKEQKSYDLWLDGEILEAFTSWEKPESSKMERDGKTKKAKSESASESGSVTDASERKKRGPMTEEAKAARNAKMQAKKALAAEPVEPVAEPVDPAAGTGLIAPAKAFKPKAVAKTVAKPTYTIEQLADLDGFHHDGKDYGRNCRGDVVDEGGEYIGVWDGKTIKSGPAPADWAEIQAVM